MKLFFFTNSYPYGFPDNWKTIELEEFSSHYEEMIIFPFSDGGSKGIKVELPKNVRVLTPMLRTGSLLQAIEILIRTVFSRLPIYFFNEFYSAKVYRSTNRFRLWFRHSYYTAAIYFHPQLKYLLNQTTPDSPWYFYWGDHMALVVPLIRKNVKNIFCRVHNSDLYTTTGGYLPYQHSILLNADLVLPCSENGKKYLEKKFPGINSKIKVARLGVLLQQNQISIRNDSSFKIISCAFLFPGKRIMLIAEALQHITFPVEWTHIGTGEEINELVQYCKRYNNSHISIHFTGYMKHEDIIPFYLAENFQSFLNVSISEGIPVSIMEAMSVGIPAIATDVGGTSELVDEHVGMLLPASITPTELARKIALFKDLSIETRQFLSSNAIKRVAELYDGRMNARSLFQKFRSSMKADKDL